MTNRVVGLNEHRRVRTALSCAPIQMPNEALQPTAPPLVLSSFVWCSAAVLLSASVGARRLNLGVRRPIIQRLSL